MVLESGNQPLLRHLCIECAPRMKLLWTPLWVEAMRKLAFVCLFARSYQGPVWAFRGSMPCSRVLQQCSERILITSAAISASSSFCPQQDLNQEPSDSQPIMQMHYEKLLLLKFSNTTQATAFLRVQTVILSKQRILWIFRCRETPAGQLCVW